MYYRDANAILAFYDKSDYKSFQSAKDSVESFSRENDQSFIGMVVANKADMNSEVSTEEGIEFASSLGALYMEVSAKTGENVKLCFEVAARACLALE
jgi:GTPase SAR1 family protein